MEIRIPISATQVACFVAGLCFGVNAHAEPLHKTDWEKNSIVLVGSPDPALAQIEQLTTRTYCMVTRMYSLQFPEPSHSPPGAPIPKRSNAWSKAVTDTKKTDLQGKEPAQ